MPDATVGVEKMVDRDGLREILEKAFEVRLKDRMLRYWLSAIGIQPAAYRNLVAPQKGRVAVYWPFTAWVVALVYRASTRRGTAGREDQVDVKDVRDMLLPYRSLLPAVRAMDEAKYIPLFMDDDNIASQLLLAFSPEFGLTAEEVVEFVNAHRAVLDVGWDDVDMSWVVMSYNSARATWAATLRFFWDVLDVESPEEKRQTLAQYVVRGLGQTFRAWGSTTG